MQAEKIIKKHVAIIHAYSMMSALQRKIVNVLLYESIKNRNHINHFKSVAVECRMPLNSLSKAIKFNSNNTQYLKETIDSLASLKIEWNLLKDKVPTEISFLNLRVLHGSPTFYQDKTLNFSFHKIMLDMVTNPSIYGSIDIDLQSQFESKYSHALYENATRFVYLQKSKIIQLNTFRKLLGVHENKYESMRELTRNVISSSIEEVNDRADFIVNLVSIKQGRKVSGFELTVKNKNMLKKLDNTSTSWEDIKLYKEIKDTFGILSDSVLNNILNNYSENYVYEKINYVKKFAKKEDSGFYPIPYFITALKDDYILNKDQPNFQTMTNKTCQWENTLKHLQYDLNHWKKVLECAQTSNNPSQVNIIKTVTLQCEQKLQLHFLKKNNIED